jgi:hypothetical protein
MTASHDVLENVLKQQASGMLLGKHLNLPLGSANGGSLLGTLRHRRH